MTNQQGAPEALRQILLDPENQPNQYGVQFLMHGPKMAFRIGNRQFTLDYEPTEPGEFEFMRDALVDAFSVFTPDVKMAQQPAPSAASKAVLAAIRAANMQLVRTGDDAFMLVTLKKVTPQADSVTAPAGATPLPLLVRDIAADFGVTPAQICLALVELGFGHLSVNMAITTEMAEKLREHFAAPTPKADSQPAPQSEPWYGHHFKEVRRGYWQCSCGKVISEAASTASKSCYPSLPRRHTYDDDGEELFTADHMRAYVDSDRAARAPALPPSADEGGGR